MTGTRRAASPLALVAFVALVSRCGKEKPAPAAQDPGNIGTQAASVASDTQVMREANSAAGEVVRAAGDCDAVKTALPEARRALDEIAGKVRTATGRTTLEAIRKRVDSIAETCP